MAPAARGDWSGHDPRRTPMVRPARCYAAPCLAPRHRWPPRRGITPGTDVRRLTFVAAVERMAVRCVTAALRASVHSYFITAFAAERRVSRHQHPSDAAARSSPRHCVPAFFARRMRCLARWHSCTDPRARRYTPTFGSTATDRRGRGRVARAGAPTDTVSGTDGQRRPFRPVSSNVRCC